MPLIGGGGAGNTAGSNPTGTSSGLNYIGDHAYCSSGEVGTNSSYEELLSFTTASNSYIVAQFTFAGATVDGSPGSGLISNFKVQINGETICQVNSAVGQGSRQQSTDVIPILLPPASKVVVTNESTATGKTVQCIVTGRVY